MYNYIILEADLIVGTLTTHSVIDKSNYVNYDSISSNIDFADVRGFSFIEGVLFPPQEPVEPTKEYIERQWRDSEISICAELKKESDHPYLTQINAYMQLLRDYPDAPSFPNGARPERPVTAKGKQIIL